jgi:hemolysin activation/secretion protein
MQSYYFMQRFLMHLVGRRIGAIFAAGVHLCSLSGVLLQAEIAVAQKIPSSVDPGQTERRLTPSLPLPELQPSFVPDAGMVVPPVGAGEARFDLREIVLRGVTVYEAADLLRPYDGLIGQTVSIDDIFAVANAITTRYRNDGYILSRAVVPAQKVDAGRIEINVIEGFISQVIISGDAAGQEDFLRAFGAKIAAVRPLTSDALERYLLLADDLPGLTARGVLRPSPSEPGAAELILVVEHRPYEGAVSVDNRGTRYSGPLQGDAGVRLNSLFGFGEQVTLRVVTTAPTKELLFGTVGLSVPLGYEGTRLDASVQSSQGEPGFRLTSSEVETSSISADLSLSHPFLRRRSENLSLRGGFDVRNSLTRSLGEDFSEDHLRVFELGLRYDKLDGGQALNVLDIRIRQGLDVFDASRPGEGLSRARGRAEFIKLSGELSRLQPLPADYALLLSLSGQRSAHALLASEEFALGGSRFGRGYDPSEVTGDHGAAMSIELRMPPTDLGDVAGLGFGLLQPYGFYDLGAAYNRDPGTGENGTQSLASTGLGVRFAVGGGFQGGIELALPLTRSVAATGEEGRDPRFFFTLTSRF